MRIIDVHAHAFPDALAPGAVAALERAGALRARYDGTIAGVIEQMDVAGVDTCVVQPVATKPGQVVSINDWIAEHGDDRVVPFGAMHPDFPDPGAEIARMKSLGLRGLKLHPEHQAFDPDEPRMQPIYEAAAAHGMIVFFHAGADVIHPTVHGTPESFAAVLDAWPTLTVVLAHLGGFRQWDGVMEHIAGRDVWLDTAYTLGHLSDAKWLELVRTHGVGRVVFGSDGPWTDLGEQLSLMQSVGLTDEELVAVLGGNAERLLRL